VNKNPKSSILFEKKDIQKNFGKKVRMLRNKLGISQGEVAATCNLHWTYISSVERGQRNVSIINIFKIANALNCSPSSLLNYED
jgi:transcriptional regulator with XRE-family HTH domain